MGKPDREMEQYWHWFCARLFSDPALEHRLLERFGTPEAVYLAKEETLLKAFPSIGKNFPLSARAGKRGILKKRGRDLSAWMSIL